MGDAEKAAKSATDPSALLARFEARLKAAEDRAAEAEARAEAAEAATQKPATGNWETVATGLAENLQKLTEMNDSGPIKQIPFHKALHKTPWHPSGTHMGRKGLDRRAYLNTRMVREQMMSDEEIRGFNTILPGTYSLDGVKIHVTLTDNNVAVTWSNKDKEAQRILAKFQTMGEILTKLIAAGPDQISQGPRVVVQV